MTKQYVFALDLKNEPEAIKAYEKHHQEVWPEIEQSIKDAGILSMQIYRWANRLMMIMVTGEDFSFEKKAKADAQNAKVQAWEELMWKYQQALPNAPKGEKWQLMNCIYQYPN